MGDVTRQYKAWKLMLGKLAEANWGAFPQPVTLTNQEAEEVLLALRDVVHPQHEHDGDKNDG